MDDEKRTIDNREVKTAIHIGNKEILYAENLSLDEPYMVCNCQWDNPLGIQVYTEAAVGTDYLEVMTEFLGRVSDQVQRVRDQRAERGVSDVPLTASDCIPGSSSAHYANQLVVIKPEIMISSARTADEQLFYATHGNGCNPEARGHAVFCKNLFTGKSVRWERYDVAGIIQPDKIPEWARQRLQEMGIAAPKPDPAKVYMASLAEARENGELEAYRESDRLNHACAASMQQAINDSHKGNYHYDFPAALKSVTEEYGTERVHVVLAHTVMRKEYDGRFSHANKEWAKSVPLPELTGDQRSYYGCEAHPAILDGFINRVREQQRELAGQTKSVLDHQKEPDRNTHTATEQQREKRPSVIKPLQEQAKAKQPHITKKGPDKKDPER